MFSPATARKLALSTLSATLLLSLPFRVSSESEGVERSNDGGILLHKQTSTNKAAQKQRQLRPRINASLTNASAFSLRSQLSKVDLDSINDIDDIDDDNLPVDGNSAEDDDTKSTTTNTPASTTSYLARQFLHAAASRSGSSGGSPVIHAYRVKDVSTIGHEVAMVASSRGCSDDVADSVKRAIEAAALADKHGLSYYLVTDETPESVITYLRQSLFFDGFSSSSNTTNTSSLSKQGGGGGELGDKNSTLPKFVVFDRAASTRNKFIVGVRNDDDDSGVEGNEGLRLPFPSDVANHVNRVVSGEIHPTLVGKPRPIGDHVPLHPSLTQVVGSSFRNIVLDPKYDVCLEAYLSNCPMCMCLAPRIRMLALLAHTHFPHVKVAVMNVDENDRPMEWMPGPAFPTLQLFNGVSPPPSSSSPMRTTNNKNDDNLSLFEKELGPIHGCSQAAAAVIANKALLSSSSSSESNIARTTFIGSSCPCVPAVDFSHPSAPGKMALPSVVELLNWVAANNRMPFNPALIKVDKSQILNSISTFRDFVPPSSATPSSDVSEQQRNQPESSTSLLTLARDMDAEAKVFEVAVFDLFYYEHMLNTAAKHKQLSRAKETNLATFKIECVDRLRRAATDAATYGTAHEAYSAMNACSDLGEELGVRDIAKNASITSEEQKNEDLAKEILQKLQK